MTTETRSSVLDPFLTTRAHFDFMLAAPEPQLLIDGDNLTVTNALDRTDDPAVLITGSNNDFINQTGATLTGTAADQLAPNAAIEISGVGNRVENQSGATVTGTGGIFSSAANTDVVNDGDIVASNIAGAFDNRDFGVKLGADSSVVNRGSISAEGLDTVSAISMGERAAVDNAGTAMATGDLAAGIEIGANGTVVNTGSAIGTAKLDGHGIIVTAPGSTVENFGLARGTSSDLFSSASGITSFSRGDANSLVWNGGTIEADALGGGNAQGVFVDGGRFVNEGTVDARATVGSSFTGNAIAAFMGDADGVNSGSLNAFSDGTRATGVVSNFEREFNNSGLINATGPQAFGFSTFDLATIINSGTVAATSLPGAPAGTSVGMDGRNGMTVNNTGAVRAEAAAEATGISAADGASIQNGDRVEAVANVATGIKVGADGDVVTTGVLIAQGVAQGAALTAGDRATIQTAGTVEATGGSATGISVGMASTVSNAGMVRVGPTGFGQGISAGDNSTVTNAGMVEVTGDGASGINTGASGTIVNTGTVDVTSTGLSADGLSGGFGTTIENRGTVSISFDGFGNGVGLFAAEAGFAVNHGLIEVVTADSNANTVIASGNAGRFENYGDLKAISTGASETSRADALFLVGMTALNAGTILASAQSGASAGALIGSGTQLTNTGDILATGPDAAGVGVGGTATLDNSGTITAGGATARGVFADGGATILNAGMITANSIVGGSDSVGIAFDESSSAQKTIQNSGTISADIAILDSAAPAGPGIDTLTLENSGRIIGNVDLGNGVDIVRNAGMIDGDVLLGAGDDEFDGRGGTVTGVVDGGDGNDVIRGGAGNDTLMGGAGNDTVAGGAGADVMDGGTRDTSVFGFDALDYSESNAGVQVNLGDATQSTSAPVKGAAGTGFGGHAEGDTFQNFQKVIGSAFDDFVYGADGGSVVELGDGNDTFDNDATLFTEDLVDLGAGNDIARTGAGDDLVDGGAGNDLLQGEDGGDWLLGGDGNDLLLGGAGADQLDGGADADALFGGADGDSLIGGAGDDLLSGGDGDDLLDGGTGNDLLLGGAGDDLFRFGADGGQDRIVGFDAGAGTGDVVDLSAFDSILSFNDVLAIASETGSGAGVSTVLTFDMATTLTFQGVRLTELNEADFLIV